MKNFTLLISILFTSLYIFAQEPDSVLVENWSDNDSYWEKSDLSLFSYSNDQLSMLFGKEYETGTGDWINFFRQEYEYSAEGYLLQTYSFFWDQDQDDWEDGSKVVYTNDAAGNPTTVTTSYLDDGIWLPAYLAENTYNANGLLAETINQTWIDPINDYGNPIKTLYSYDSNGNRTQVVHQNYPDLEWVNFSQTITQYTSFNAEEIVTRQTWNAGNNDWIDNSKRTYTYNSDESALHSLLEKYNTIAEEWQNDEQDNYTNYANGTVYQVVTQKYDFDLEEWENDIRTTISYRFSTAASSITPLFVGVYPNPSSTDVQIQLGENAVWSTYTITDMNGKILANDSFYGANTRISIDRLATGIYILEVEANGKTGIVRLVRE